ncbi:DUF6364 family protein [Coleofasciculus sp. G2-EDA-02]|uniref:DUF6364 family protein n=1 Tax=Coleofasciculus sp. G2-EDA-02 TaxID=3069529 RepID=UPI0032F52B10
MARKRITLSLDEDLLERIKLAAEKGDRKISNEVERILIKHYPPPESESGKSLVTTRPNNSPQR